MIMNLLMIHGKMVQKTTLKVQKVLGLTEKDILNRPILSGFPSEKQGLVILIRSTDHWITGHYVIL
jgi:hypothetical protein